MRALALALLIAAPAYAQEPSDSLVKVELQGEVPATHVQIRSEAGILLELEVPDPCATPCVLRTWITLPDADVWATARNANGVSDPSNRRPGISFPNLYTRADVNGDGVPSVGDIIMVNRMIFSEAPGAP